LPRAPAQAQSKASLAPPDLGSSSADRWVAVIYGNIPITREELGEYLILRNTDKLELLVNKRIIEQAGKVKGLEVTPAEVDAALSEDLAGMKIDLNTFVGKVLKQYHKTLFEWKEDVIRPKLLMTKLCKDRVEITEKDFQDAFQAHFGEKIECRIVLFPRGEEKNAMKLYAELRRSDADFDRIARQQASPTLAMKGGEIAPIAWHTTGNDELEKEAFSLQPGEISRLIDTPQGTVVIKCIRRRPAEKDHTLDKEREVLRREIFDKKLQLEMPKLFKELQEQAAPKLFLKKYITEAELERDVKRELQSTSSKPGDAAGKPHGN
jgi:hypothetical protein